MHPDQKTLDELNAPKAYQEFPKMLHHPDGSTVTVENATEEAALSDDYQANPADAADMAKLKVARLGQFASKYVVADDHEEAKKDAKKAAAEADDAKTAHDLHEDAKKAAKK